MLTARLAAISTAAVLIGGCGLVENDDTSGGAGAAGGANSVGDDPASTPALPRLAAGSPITHMSSGIQPHPAPAVYSAIVTDITCTALPDYAQMNVLTDGYFYLMSTVKFGPLEVGRAADIRVTWLGLDVATTDPDVCKIDVLSLERDVPEELKVELRVDCPSTLTFQRSDGAGEQTGTAIPSSYTVGFTCGVVWPEEWPDDWP